jgi:hypothetical protein
MDIKAFLLAPMMEARCDLESKSKLLEGPASAMLRCCRTLTILFVAVGVASNADVSLAGPPRQAISTSWPSDCELQDAKALTISGLGALQGVSFHAGNVYLYGDCYDVKPRVGVIREYSKDFKPTGKMIWLRSQDKPLLRHPTGLTWHSRWGTFLGDTVARKAVIYCLNWERALADGDLNRAVLAVIDDDAAVNGCRPEFVSLDGRDFLATADYGDTRPEIRLYDPQKLLDFRRTSAPGVTAHRFLAPSFNQNLHWDADTGQLTCVVNVIEGRGWRLQTVDLKRAVADGRAWGPAVSLRNKTLPYRDELEGYRPLPNGLGLFVTSSRKNNLVIGRITPLHLP